MKSYLERKRDLLVEKKSSLLGLIHSPEWIIRSDYDQCLIINEFMRTDADLKEVEGFLLMFES